MKEQNRVDIILFAIIFYEMYVFAFLLSFMLSSFRTLLFYNLIKYEEIKVVTRSITVDTYTNFLYMESYLFSPLSAP